MLYDVRTHPIGQPCTILGSGRTVLSEGERFDNRQFIHAGLSEVGRSKLYESMFGGPLPDGLSDVERSSLERALDERADEKFREVTGIESRYIFDGNLSDLAALAAQDALDRTGINVDEIDAILVATNTPDEYNIANGVKKRITASVDAYCNTMMAACTVGASVVFEGWKMVRLGFRRVLCIGAERATTLASKDHYKAANLFGDAAFALVLGPADHEAFTFFAYRSDPFENADGKDQSRFIRRLPSGFDQDGPDVHKYVAKVLPAELQRIFKDLDLDPASIDHFIPHQASRWTNEVLVDKLKQERRWGVSFRAVIHSNVVEMGNTSAASTGWLYARAEAQGLITSGQRCLVASFGAGMSYTFYLFTAP
ncbi:MAG: hypothetical protein HY975_03455 [Candidatus Kerfeldbacteria bacterium]|nr:hypothetical protein [Candidatus Kerfeldbacteria bacterium]